MSDKIHLKFSDNSFIDPMAPENRWVIEDDSVLDDGEEDEDGLGLQESTGSNEENSFRLIEKFFPSDAVSERSHRERYQRGKTPHTIFTWWARRPYAAACGVVATSLIKVQKVESGARDLVDDYCRTEKPGLLGIGVRKLMSEGQRVLDPFGGGGTIPLEAARLGARVYTMDNNELSHFIQTSILRLSQQSMGIAELVEREGTRVLEQLREETDDFYPRRHHEGEGRTIAYLWSRELQCPECDGWLSLMRRPWLAKRGEDRQIFIERAPVLEEKAYSFEIREEGEPQDSHSAWDGRQLLCPFCEHQVEREDLAQTLKDRARDYLLVTCTSEGRRSGSGKVYHRVENPDEYVPEGVMKAAIAADLNAMTATLPPGELPRWSGVTNPSLYGLERHVELFNLRQRALLVRLSRILRESHETWKEEMGPEKASVVVALLSALIDQLVDWNGRLSTWISQNEQVGRALSGPGMAMVWDHVEIDPLEEAPANLWDKLDRIVEGVRSIPRFDHIPTVIRGDARELPFDDGYFDVVATDPPYFDNIFYNILADCVYVWKRLALQEIFPGHFSAELTDSSRELTMNRHVHESKSEATEYYSQGMEQVLSEIRRVLKPKGVVSLVFAHSTVEGWASVLSAFIRAGLDVSAAWPMYVERQHRPRGMSSRAINTSFVLVAKKRRGGRAEMQWPRFETMLRHTLANQATVMQLDEKYGPDTRGRTLFGRGISLFSQAGRILEDGQELSVVEVLGRISILIEEFVGVEAWGVKRG